MWFLSALNGCSPLIILNIKSLNISMPGRDRMTKISSGVMLLLELWDLIKIYDIINANTCVPASPK